MRITYVATGRIPTERAFGYATMKLCEEFAKAGNDVTLLIPARREDIQTDPFVHYRIAPTFTIERLPASDHVDIAGPQVMFAYWRDLLSFIGALRRARIAKRDGVFYTREYLLLPFLPRGRTTLELHSIPTRRSIFKWCINKAHNIVVISHGLRTELCAMGVKEKNIVVAPDAVDLQRFEHLPTKEEARATLSLPQDKPIALYSGHFYGWKGADMFAAAAKHMPQVLCVLVGGVDDEYKKLKEEYKSSENVLVLPFQPHEKVPLYLASADVLVLPNRSDSTISSTYTSPLKLFEYMASGRPIVASDLPSIREIVDEHTAVLVKADDPEALSEGVKKVLADRSYAERLAAAAKEKVKQYTWEARAKSILDFLK